MEKVNFTRRREKVMSLTIKNLCVALQGKEILQDIDLHIKDGELISLLGPSGCGKSTLLKSIAGLLEMKSGSVLLNQSVISDVVPEKRGMVIVFQDLRLFPHMTVEKNICFPMELQKIPKAKQKEQVRELLAEVQLSGYEKRKIQEMSGGQLQRVALARALAAYPKVLLLDEPFSGLNEALRIEMGSLVKRLHRERNLVTILVTHDKKEALRLADKIAFMNDGEILQYDTPEKIFRCPQSKTVAEYFGKVNYLAGCVKNGQFSTDLIQFRTGLQDGNYEAMLRPTDVQLTEVGKYPVTHIDFMGEIVEIEVETEQGIVVSQMLSSEMERLGIAKGKKVGIQIDDSYLVWFQSK